MYKKMRRTDTSDPKRFRSMRNILLIQCLIVLPLIFASTVSTEQFQIKKEHLNKRLIGHAIVESFVKNIHDCARDCFSISLCKSIDYYRGRCKLNDADSQSVISSEFENKDGSIFSDIEDWPNTMAGSCGQKPCEDKQMCLPGKHNPRCIDTVTLTDCKEIRGLYPSSHSGQYKIKLWKSHDILNVVCDMETDGGGWTVFQNRFNGSVDFYRNSTEYENGFGSLDTEFWLGLKFMQEMASKEPTELRFDLTAGEGVSVYVTFQNFYLDLGPFYTIHLDTGQGTAGDSYVSYGMSYQNGMHFTTKDIDRDQYIPENCADNQHGAWWYNGCGGTNLNGDYATPGAPHPDGYWFGIFYQPYSLNSLKATKLMFR